MPRGGFRPGSGRKPGSGLIAKLHAQARGEAASLIGTDDDPLRLGLKLVKNEGVPVTVRAQLILGLLRVVHPVLVSQNVQSTSLHMHMAGDVLAAKTALLLERGAGMGGEAEADDYDLEGEAEPDVVMAELESVLGDASLVDAVAELRADLSPADVVMADVLAGVD